MPSIFIECSYCGAEGKIDEAMLGRQLKCAKCGHSFKAEIGGSYDLAEPPPPPRPTRAPSPPSPEASGQSKPKAKAKANAKKTSKADASKPALDEKLSAMLDAWAEE